MKEWAVITGGGRGIGAALSIILAERGYNVLVVDLNTEPIEKLKRCSPVKDLVVTLQGDLSKEETLNEITKVIPSEDHIKYLIPCQRIGNVAKMEDIKISALEEAMKVHVYSPVMVFQKLLPRLKAAKGRILHTDTLIECYPEYGYGAYGISKTAYHKLGQQLRLELADTDVCVGSAYPGQVNSEGFQTDYRTLKAKNLLSQQGIDLHERNLKEDTFLEPNVSASFLSFVLLETNDEEFEKVEWRANDKSQWYRWKK